jgi:hypothetical protein
MNKLAYLLVVLGCLSFILPSAFAPTIFAKDARSSPAICIECLKIRVGLPIVEQGPAPNIADNKFSVIQLPDGRFRGFTAAAETFAVDGRSPSDMGGPLRKVLGRGAPGKYGESGKWINHVERSGNLLLGWIHDETGDAPGQGLKSMSLAKSRDDGLNWEDVGQIVTGKGALTRGNVIGEGDCSVVNGQDGYDYAYCWRNPYGAESAAEIVARAPASDPNPGKWMKYYQGKWDQPGVGGDSTGLAQGVGGSAARWSSTNETLLLGWTKGGVGLHLSTDGTTFTSFVPLREPLLVLDPGTWNRPAPTELIAYQVLIDAKTGSNQLSNAWLMAYMSIQPNESFDKRYLVIRSVDVSMSNAPISPQVGVLLARWYNAGLHDRWSTTAPVPPTNGSAYELEAKSGYLMTVADPAKPSVELEDCVSQWPGHPDHMLDQKGVCEADHYGFRRLRTAGWVYSKPQEQTIPLYRCYNAQQRSHFASNAADCEKLGVMERLLGYALSQ